MAHLSEDKELCNAFKDIHTKYNFWMVIYEHKPSFKAFSAYISRKEQRNANSQLSQHKTFSYVQSISARSEAQTQGYDDALLLSTTGEMCCATTANLIIKRNNQFLTPRNASGCLPGIMREQGLRNGTIKQALIDANPMEGDFWMQLNSLGCQPIRQINDIELPIFNQCKEFWYSLID